MQRFIAGACLAVALWPTPAHAQWADQQTQYFDDGAVRTEPNLRRSDVTVGASGGMLAGAASGFPNELAKIDDPQYEAKTGFGFGGFANAWLGGALSDWLTFAIGFAGGNLTGSEGNASLGGLLFRVETYPLIGLGGALGDVGVFTNVGVGSLTIEQSGKEDGEGGSLSFLAFGAFYEAWRLGHFALGPSAEYMHLWSLTGTLDAAHVGARIAYYGGPD